MIQVSLPRRPTRRFRKPALIAFGSVFMAMSVASAAEPEWPKQSASDLAMFVVLQRYRIYAEHCSARIPELRPRFDSTMRKLVTHIQEVSKDLLASGQFDGMQNKPVPAEIIFAFKDILHDVEHNFERQDAVVACPKALQKLGDMDGDTLKSGLSDHLTAVQNMIRNLDKERVRQASPKAS